MSGVQYIKDYLVVSRKGKNELVDRINSMIATGWQPLGGVQLERNIQYDADVLFVQTMVRYDDP